jgi:hypothetical protein
MILVPNIVNERASRRSNSMLPVSCIFLRTKDYDFTCFLAAKISYMCFTIPGERHEGQGTRKVDSPGNIKDNNKRKLRGLSPRVNYTEESDRRLSAKLVPNFEDSVPRGQRD